MHQHPEQHEVLIVGAGFAGLGAAIRLRQAGEHRFVLLEQGAAVGGTWFWNRYPGAACDVPAVLYSLSFAPNAAWSRRYPQQAEVQAYLESLVPRFGLGPHLRLNSRVLAADWDAAHSLWHVRWQGADGRERLLSVRAIVSATGGLSQPKLPAIEGLADFSGPVVHSARWPDGLDLRGLRVGIVGTGASALQIVPKLAPEVAHLSVFQRTPPWVVARHDHAVSPGEQGRRQRWPLWLKAQRAAVYAEHEVRAPLFTRWPQLLKLAGRQAQRHLHAQVPAGALRIALQPHYLVGCKRVLISDDYYPALQRPNVALVASAVRAAESHAVRCADGSRHELDALILATGFEAADPAPPFALCGRDGLRLEQAWAQGAQAHWGCTVAGFPNFFMLIGPNTGLGHNSIVFMIESQLNYLMGAVGVLRQLRAGSLEVRPEAQGAFNAELQQRLPRTVWAVGGCNSWYHSQIGRSAGRASNISTLWPGGTLEFRRRTRQFDVQNYDIRALPPAAHLPQA